MHRWLISVAARSKEYVCGPSLTRNVSSSPSEGIVICLL